MNIVILTILLPYPLTSGGAQAQYNMIERLRLKHKLTIIYPENGMNTLRAQQILQERWPEVVFSPYRYVRQLLHFPFACAKVKRAVQLRLMAHNERFLAKRILEPYGYPLHPDFLHFVKEVLLKQHADLLQVEFYPYLSVVRRLSHPVCSIFVHHEIRYVRNKRLLSSLHLTNKERWMYDRLKRQEIEDLNTYDRIVTLTDTDKSILEQDGVHVPIAVSPAAVGATILPYKEWKGTITFLGGYGHTPNQEGMEWFLNRVLPLIEWERFPNVCVQIVGSGWPSSYESVTRSIPVTCMGFVENLESVVEGSLMIVPILSGSGMRMKLLEAAAMSLPIVTTHVGAEGLPFVHHENCLMADSPECFAQALSELMMNASLRKTLADAANKLFVEKYSADALAEVRSAVYCF